MSINPKIHNINIFLFNKAHYNAIKCYYYNNLIQIIFDLFINENNLRLYLKNIFFRKNPLFRAPEKCIYTFYTFYTIKKTYKNKNSIVY